jgi:hypothetical protein
VTEPASPVTAAIPAPLSPITSIAPTKRSPLLRWSLNPVAAELARLNATLERIVGLLERQLQDQRLDLMLKLVDVASRQVDFLEGELSRLPSGRSSLVDERI